MSESCRQEVARRTAEYHGWAVIRSDRDGKVLRIEQPRGGIIRYIKVYSDGRVKRF